jgi:phosphoglucosamine mutase
VPFEGEWPLQALPLRAAIVEAEAELARTGRLLIRKSGTEPVLRVMAEGEDAAQVARIVDGLCAQIASAAE